MSKRKRTRFSDQLIASTKNGKPSPKQAFVPGMTRQKFNPKRPASPKAARRTAEQVFKTPNGKPGK